MMSETNSSKRKSDRLKVWFVVGSTVVMMAAVWVWVIKSGVW